MGIARVVQTMIQANCRDRFTAEDFDFVVRTLGKSPRDSVSLLELLTDTEARDSILDHSLLFDTMLSKPTQLSISPQLYFYVLARHVLKEAGFTDRKMTDYIASLLETFSRAARTSAHSESDGGPGQYMSDLLLALQHATPTQSFLIRAHVGNYSLFVTGIFPENVEHRRLHGAPDFGFYEDMGKINFHFVSSHAVARSCALNGIFEALAENFHAIRLALNRLSERLLNLDRDDSHLLLT